MRTYYVYIMASRSRVLYGVTADIRDAIAREKQVKSWTRTRRVGLIQQRNPFWQDLTISPILLPNGRG